MLAAVVRYGPMVLEIVTIIALVAGPILAVEVQKGGDQRRERRTRQLGVFRSLMATRAERLGFEHVKALNMIDVEFSGSARARPILDAWKTYLDHLNRDPQTEGWLLRGDDLFADLLYAMSVFLGYKFDRIHLKNQAYWPRAHANLENDNAEIRKGVIAVLSGKTAITVRAGEAEPPPTATVVSTGLVPALPPNKNGER